jgi:hypothetical protein
MLRRGQRVGNLRRHVERLVERQRAFLQPIGQRLAVEILHDEKRHALLIADVVERADVRMGELRDGARLAIEPIAEQRIGRECIGKDFDRDRAVEPGVSGFVDLAHTAGPEGGQDLERPEAPAGTEGQPGVIIRGESEGGRRRS